TTIAICWAVPGPLVGPAGIAAFNQPGPSWLHWVYDHTIAAPVVAQAIRSLPLSTLVVWHAFATLPRETLQNALLDGASSWKTFLRIMLPARKSALLVAWLIALAASLGELDASI